jgi:putative redox protein
MEIRVRFPGGKRVDAEVGGHVVRTDQPVAAGGDDSAPAPFDMFLASLATCAGIYVLGFCQARKIPTEDINILQRQVFDPDTKQLVAVTLELELPPGFPQHYRDAVVRAATGCKVKKLLANPPTISVVARSSDAKAA